MTPERARQAISLVDLTDLSDDASVAAIDGLCDRALAHTTAAVCVWPDFVAQAAARLDGSPVSVATVVNFPSGDDRPFPLPLVEQGADFDEAQEPFPVPPHANWLRRELDMGYERDQDG